ncbi:hypothetical protein BDV93DRAFT_528805 [Ceratobasidium sp. AG-I]|nr:hypothetical protein BDV93DRAFT_528805 [Ceratobasidium sp. AG-I]
MDPLVDRPVRHRIEDITLEPNISKFPIELRLLVDGQEVYRFVPVKTGDPLRWDLISTPCDVHLQSQVVLMFTEQHRLSAQNRVGFLEYIVSDLQGEPTVTFDMTLPTSGFFAFGFAAKNRSPDIFTVKINLLSLGKIEKYYAKVLESLRIAVTNESSFLGGDNTVANLFRTILDFAHQAAELYTNSKLVLVLWMKAWENLVNLGHFNINTQRIVDGLMQMRPFIESVKHRLKETNLRSTILSLLGLIEDISNFIIGHLSDTAAAQLLHIPLNENTSKTVDTLLRQFGNLKEDFERGAGVQVLQSFYSSGENTILVLLNRGIHNVL